MSALAGYYSLGLGVFVVVHDDIDLPSGPSSSSAAAGKAATTGCGTSPAMGGKGPARARGCWPPAGRMDTATTCSRTSARGRSCRCWCPEGHNLVEMLTEQGAHRHPAARPPAQPRLTRRVRPLGPAAARRRDDLRAAPLSTRKGALLVVALVRRRRARPGCPGRDRRRAWACTCGCAGRSAPAPTIAASREPPHRMPTLAWSLCQLPHRSSAPRPAGTP
ncbi:hypothetical protein QJS66_07945 [Kocuria rhizophila]|nr:hypothetical protein QJS66_07945 [Kocuria rhizophila]